MIRQPKKTPTNTPSTVVDNSLKSVGRGLWDPGLSGMAFTADGGMQYAAFGSQGTGQFLSQLC
ncbi:uncharacterized protein CANTADRAFT_323133 [Suhomyces tanzawaensis NRRL Y-17324]|uniref:Uncharacterized protein n=1 Tax=Suhomyces tanzawaensis NRRL Y-17324 TaxID=984487 RepID=A0A1E4SBX0_9ASCO|nr:uncharacterized protein CANTADRAFT_323133 [Suhomyces tanzawaensis NRRL Y-17324]ODV77030.1 hypothetical protein CANTADRAFT_323133 [Suhomyces tanzawaensis NRRL Y-17324]